MSATYTTIDSPLGPLLATSEGGSLTGLSFHSPRRPAVPESAVQPAVRGSHGRPAVRAGRPGRDDDRVLLALERQLTEYFDGERRAFNLPLAPRGSEFELLVWSALLAIPHGETRSYGEIAREVCTIRAARAVGLANARNPIAVIVPCHRVIGSDGSLTGYGGGLERKRMLLDLEAGRLQLAPPSPEISAARSAPR